VTRWGEVVIGEAGMSGTGTDWLDWFWIGRRGVAQSGTVGRGEAGKLYGD